MVSLFRPSHSSKLGNAKALHDACRVHSLDAVNHCLRVDSLAAASKDEYGNTPLHRLLLSSSSTKDFSSLFPITQRLLQVHPDSIQTPNHDGSLPIHLAALAGVTDINYWQLLVDTDPTTVQQCDTAGLLPLHEACRNKNIPLEPVILLLQTYPDAVGRATLWEERLPLHYACTETPQTFTNQETGKPAFEVLWALLELGPDAVLCRDGNGDTPWDLLQRVPDVPKHVRQLVKSKFKVVQLPSPQERQRAEERNIQQALWRDAMTGGPLDSSAHSCSTTASENRDTVGDLVNLTPRKSMSRCDRRRLKQQKKLLAREQVLEI